MQFIKPLSPVIQVFLLVAAGYVFAHWKEINLTSLTELVVYLGTPSLVFSSLASKPLFATDIAVLFGGIALMFAGADALIGNYFYLFAIRSHGFAMPILFMNAGNMGIPLALFAFGQAACSARPYVRDAHLAAVFVGNLHLERSKQLEGNFSPAADLCGVGRPRGQSRADCDSCAAVATGHQLGQATIPIMLI